MPKQFTLNPFTGSLDEISVVAIDTPANGLSIDSSQILSIDLASSTLTGALSSTDWNTFNSKQPAGNYITALTGDGTATGPGSVPFTLATVNADVGTFSYPTFTVNAKGLVTAASSNTPVTSFNTRTGAVTLLSADVTTALGYTPENLANKGIANGYAPLDGAAKIPVTYLPSAVFIYQGLWDPSTNTPTLIDGTGTTGYVYYVSVAFPGPVTGLNNPTMVNFQVGDLVIYNGTTYELTTPAAGVSSVNGSSGAVIVNAINQITGDATAGPASQSQSAALTLATVNSNVGSFTNASITVNAKGLVTAASSGSAPLSPTLTNTHIFVGNASNIATDVALSGDATLANTGALTLSTVNANVGSFGTASSVSAITVNAKGLITAAASTSIQITESQVTNLTTDLAGKLSTTLTSAHLFVGNGSNVATDVALSGDATLSNAGALTLSTVNANVGSFGTAASTGTFTVNAKGLITAASSTAIQITESQVTNLTTDLAAKQSTTLTNAHILVGNGSNVATDVAVSGDVTIANTGAVTLATVNSNVGSFTNASITVNAKGLITAASTGAASTTFTVTSQSTTYAILTTDYTVLNDATSAAYTVTLPTAVGASGKVYVIKKTDSTFNIVTIATTSSQTIDGVTTKKLATQYEAITVQSDGANWAILDRRIPSTWTSYTPTFTGFGTPTSVECYWRRVGDSIELNNKFAAGTTTATEARVSFPTGVTSDGSGKIPSIKIAGNWINAVVDTTHGGMSLVETSVTYVTFGPSGTFGNNSVNPLTKINGNSVITTGNSVAITALVPIVNWEG